MPSGLLRLTREENLLALRRCPFVPQTKMSRHGFDIALRLTRGFKPPPSVKCASPRSSSIWRSSSTLSRAGSSERARRPSRSEPHDRDVDNGLDVARAARNPAPMSLEEGPPPDCRVHRRRSQRQPPHWRSETNPQSSSKPNSGGATAIRETMTKPCH